jgi:hypothetical protein
MNDNYEGLQIVAEEWSAEFKPCGVLPDLWIMIMEYGLPNKTYQYDSLCARF